MWALSTEQDASEGIGQPKKQLDKENDSCNKCQHDDSRVDGFTVNGTNDVAVVVDETVDEGHVLLVGPMEEIYHIAHIEWQQTQKKVAQTVVEYGQSEWERTQTECGKIDMDEGEQR